MRSLLVVLCVLGPLGALPARGELPKDEQKCIVEINRNVAKVAKAQGKEICRCIKNGAKGKLVEATIEDCLTADGRGKVDKARSKLSAKLADKCPTDPNAAPGFGVPTEVRGDPGHIVVIIQCSLEYLMMLRFGAVPTMVGIGGGEPCIRIGDVGHEHHAQRTGQIHRLATNR